AERRAKRVRSSALFGADPRDLTPLGDGQCCEQLGDELPQIRDAVRWRTQRDNGDGKARQILLKGKITVDRDEGIEFVLRSTQEFAVRQRRPAGVWHGLHVVSLDVAREAPIDTQGHDVKTVPDAGWAALTNGELLRSEEHTSE